jgi:hypothetical protein
MLHINECVAKGISNWEHEMNTHHDRYRQLAMQIRVWYLLLNYFDCSIQWFALAPQSNHHLHYNPIIHHTSHNQHNTLINNDANSIL